MTMRKLVIAMVVMAIAGIATAQTITVEPSDDMYSDPEHPGAHPADELWTANYDPTGNYQRIMVKFDIDDYMGQEIDSAMFNLNRFFGCPSGDPTHTNFYDITVSWDESSWPENSHISHGATVWANYVFNADGWHQIDITPLVQEWLDGTTPNYGFVIEAIPDNKFSKFHSKEAASSVRPYLELHGATGIDDKYTIPENFTIQIYPNPFNSSVAIAVNVGDACVRPATIEIYDLRGTLRLRSVPDDSETRSLSGGCRAESRQVKTTGTRTFIWSPAQSIASGLYFVKARTEDGRTATKKIMYLR